MGVAMMKMTENDSINIYDEYSHVKLSTGVILDRTIVRISTHGYL